MSGSVTARTVEGLIDGYIAFARGGKLDPKLVKGLHTAVTALGGKWEYEDDHPVPSCFSGVTIVCWRFSGKDPKDAAALYKDFVLKNYNVWVHMQDKASFQAQCHVRTDTLPDWQQITKEIAQRHAIFQEAINVTSGMYGDGANETKASEKLWNGRLAK